MMKGHEASRHMILSDKLESKKGLTWMKWYFFGEKMGRTCIYSKESKKAKLSDYVGLTGVDELLFFGLF